MNNNVLLVEDQAAATTIMDAIRAAGVHARVEVISDPEQAIAFCRGAGDFADRRQYPEPDLVLVDAELPRGRGLNVLKSIRTESSFKRSVVVVLSSSRHLSDVASAYSLGANAFLVKPQDELGFQTLVGALTTFWLTQNVPPPVM